MFSKVLCWKLANRPWAVGQNYFVSWHPCGEHWVCGIFERHIGVLLPKKVPKRKTCQILTKWGIFYYLLLNCIIAKKFEILNSTITKTTCIMRTSTKKLHIRHLNIFLFLKWFLSSICCRTPIFKLEPSFYCTILVQSSHLKQKNNSKTIQRIKKLFKCLICSFFVLFSDDASRFCYC